MTTEPRDPHVRRLVFELLDAAPAPPPFPAGGVADTEHTLPHAPRPRSLLVAALTVLLVVGTVTAVVVTRRAPAHKGPVAAPGGAPAVAYVDGRGLVVRSPS